MILGEGENMAMGIFWLCVIGIAIWFVIKGARVLDRADRKDHSQRTRVKSHKAKPDNDPFDNITP